MIWQKKKLAIFLIIVFLVPISYYLFKKFIDQKKSKLDKVTIAAYHGDSAALIYLAKDKGLFRKNGVEVEIKDYSAGKLAVDDLVLDKVDMATATESVLVSNSFKNRDLKIVTVISEGSVNRLVARKDHGIKEIDDLRGKKFALTKKSTGEYYLSQFLYLHNLNFSEIEIIDANPSEIVAQVVNGEVDAGYSWDPYIYEIEEKIPQKTIIWDTQTYESFYFLLITKNEWIHGHPQCAIKIVKALLEAEKIINEDEGWLANSLKNNFNYSDEYLKYILGKHQYYVHLPQGLLVELEDQAFWRIKNNLTQNKKMPDFLNFIYPYALEAADPLRVGVIR
ncbi:MAG: NrtA/SsuA/CpmA family ABC transporter substrate-binding protein [Candidatus Omnitrophica bacterium]|nr:NrtA/SsuA/CpmA family ABC transporter substrate-binding protein [Candidatus Omnitrophota bacterium]